MASGKLNSLSIERAHRFGGPVLLLSDGDGLYFRKQTREGAAWMFRYRFAGRERWMTLGNYPDMSLAAARIEAREKRLMLDKRRDPLFAKQEAEKAQRAAIAAQKARQTFRELAEDWYSTEIDPRRLKHPKVPRRYLDKYLLPAFGERVPAEITAADAARLLAQVRKSAPTAANDLLRFMRRVFRFGVRRHVLTSNPVADFDQSDAGGPERARKRALSVEELGKLLKALRELPELRGRQPPGREAPARPGRSQRRVARRPMERARSRQRSANLAPAGQPDQNGRGADDSAGARCCDLAQIAARGCRR